jgi:DNA-binding beta-propeller fold protein YncE
VRARASAARPSLLVALALLSGCVSSAGVPSGASVGYSVYVASESADEVSLIRFDGGVATVERQRTVGSLASELDAPHGLAISPDGRHYYVTLGHGRPYGWLWKMSVEEDEVVGRTMLGHFPASVDLTPDGEYAFVSNFNLHGDHLPSSVSKVHLPSMHEVARTETCVMPHGSRVNPQGTRHYSTCMMDQLLVEIDVPTGAVARMFSVAPGREGPAAARRQGEHRMPRAGVTVCSPTWASPSHDGTRIFVACNRSNEILEIDVESWTLVRRFSTGEGPYNLEPTPDGRLLLATLKNRDAPATEVFDLATGRSLRRIANTTVLPHGIAISGDSRFAFVSVEGVGAEAGRVDVIDIAALSRVASVEVGQQAAGIAVVRSR